MTITLPSGRKEFSGVAEAWERDIRPFLAENEARRARAVRMSATVVGVAALVALPFLLRAAGSEGAFIVGALAIAGGMAGGGAILAQARRQISDGLLGRLAEVIGVEYRRDAAPAACIGDLRRLRLIGDFERERWEDEVRGERDGASFELVEADLYRMRQSRNGRKKVTVFHGAIVEIDYPKRFAGETVVQRDRGPLNRFSRPGPEFSRVGLASPEFERAFEAWSTDQVEARALLDPMVLERFQALETLFDGKNLRAAFVGGRIAIAIETGDRLNMGSMFRRLDRPDRVETILQEFDMIFDLIDLVAKAIDRPLDGPVTPARLRAMDA